MVGLARGTVRLVTYRREWKRLYEAEARRLRSTFGEGVGIEYVGSTAIDGMDAKPIIDVLVLVESFDEIGSIIRRLEAQGYEHRDDSVPGRRFFTKGPEHDRTHYLSVTERGSERHEDQVVFREYLRENPTIAERYRRLKRELAAEYPEDRDSYTAKKAPFIEDVLDRASAEGYSTEVR